MRGQRHLLAGPSGTVVSMHSSRALVTMALALVAIAPGCGGGTTASDVDAGPGILHAGADAALPDANPCAVGQAQCNGSCIDVTRDDANCGACSNVCQGAQHCAAAQCQASKIEHVVLIVQENHTFDSYFGRFCTAPAGSNPTCTAGPSCCEAAPAKDPSGASPTLLDDTANFGSDHDHAQACELQQINGGKMDGYVTGSSGADTCLGSGPSCASAGNFALADQTSVGAYWTLAGQNALADRYFQPIVGGSSSNDMYFATAHFQFVDNSVRPDTIGTPVGCLDNTCGSATKTTYMGRTTIADLLLDAGKTFTVYADGYAHAKADAPSCEGIPSDCPYSVFTHPEAAEACLLDASDIPYVYYSRFAGGANMKDFPDLATDLATNKLASFSYMKAREFHNEHPNVSTISDGIAVVQGILKLIAASSYASSTLVLLTWDEGGGFFDHVAPPAAIDTDDSGKPVPYGTRVALLAIGPFAKVGTVSHVTMEHSSVLRFLEYNFLGKVGQLEHNDAKVKNLGSLLEATKTGIVVPD